MSSKINRPKRKGADDVKRKRNEVDEPYSGSPPRSPESPMNDNNNALKIKIKIQPHGQAPNPRVGLLGFDALLELRASLINYAHHTGEWTDTMYAGLRTQLEGAKSTISFLSGEVSQHLQVLEAWKPPQDESFKRKQPDSDKKGKKRRAHEAGENEYSSYSSPEEQEVDVEGEEGGDVDVEAIDGDELGGDGEEGTKEDEYTPKAKSNNRAAVNRKMAQIVRGRTKDKGVGSSANRRKFLKLQGGNIPRRKDIPTSTSPVEYDAGVAGAGISSEEEEEEATPLALGPNAFWTAMEPYLRNITDSDLGYITPKASRSDDPIFNIPSLGNHYSQVWAAEDGLASPPPRPSLRAIKGEGEFDYPEDEDADPLMLDMTQRILQSLIDEMYTYSRENMINLEQRIRMELRSIGLLDDEGEIDPTEREDDEICAELRSLQNSLREAIITNNNRRNNLIALVKPKMREQEEARKMKLNNQALEKNFTKLIQRKKKRGGRRAPPPQVG